MSIIVTRLTVDKTDGIMKKKNTHYSKTNICYAQNLKCNEKYIQKIRLQRVYSPLEFFFLIVYLCVKDVLSDRLPKKKKKNQ